MTKTVKKLEYTNYNKVCSFAPRKHVELKWGYRSENCQKNGFFAYVSSTGIPLTITYEFGMLLRIKFSDQLLNNFLCSYASS